ncbi:Myc-type, basic helix-loop-helix domain-containing protein [Tanacetum coccineum]
MKAAVLWTINDFPARSSLSGWSGQGYYACPTCNEDTPSMAVKSKIVYVGHRRFLRTKHPLRSKFKEFYGFPEPKPKPRKFTEMDIQLQISKVFKRFPGKHPDIAKKNPKPNRNIELNWKRQIQRLLNGKAGLGNLRGSNGVVLVKKPNGKFEKPIQKEALTFCWRYLKDDVETRFNCLGRNDNGLPEEEPDNSKVFVKKKVTDDCSEELFSLACGPTSACTYPACIVNGVKFVVHERDILHTTQCSGVSTPGLDGEMYNGQLEEILELTYIGHRKAYIYFDDRNFTNIHQSFLRHKQHKGYSTFKTLLDKPRGGRSSNMFIISDVAEYDQMYTGSSSSYVTLCVVAHVLDDDDVVVSDDDEVNPNGCVVLDHYGGDAGGSPPRRPIRPVPIPSAKLGFDYADLGTFHPLGNFASMLNSLMGETVRPLPLACEWEEIPEVFKAHIYPTLEKVEKGHYEDLIETWRKGHSSKKTGEFKTEQNKQRYLDIKAMQDRIKAGPFKTDQEILDEVVPSDNRQNMSGMGRKLPGGGSTSRRRTHRAYGDVMNRDQMTQILRQQEQEKELYRKQAEEAQQRAYLASLKADQADQRANVAYQNTE